MVIVGLHDLTISTGPVAVVTTESADKQRAVAELAKSLLPLGPRNAKDLRAVEHEASVLIGQRATIERYQQAAGNGRDDFAEALEPMFAESAELGHPMAAFVYAPGGDARRVLRDLWPQLLAPFAKLDGKLLGDGIRQVVAIASCPPEWNATIDVLCESAAAAATVCSVLDAAWQTLIDKLAGNESQEQLAEVARRGSRILAAERDGERVVIGASHDDGEVGELFDTLVLPALNQARASAARSGQMKQFKQMALAMLNFESTDGFLPASAAIVDEEGKPLLSWRVAILPYLEQQALYNEFHLDEPWDSPHNMKLARTIPSAYIDPAHRDLAAEGKTTYQLPVHERSVFPPASDNVESEKRMVLGRDVYVAVGTSYRDITDGTSNTVMIVETQPEDAVIWTQPADWEVDLARAWQQLKGDSTKGSTVSAFCDGSTRAWDRGVEVLEERLPKLITRDGQEVIEW